MKPIGGFFELELRNGREYHTSALRLNTGRNALEYVLRANAYHKVYLPSFWCDVMLQPIQRLGISHQFYCINRELEPIFDYDTVRVGEAFVYVNYFGLKDQFVRSLAQVCSNLIIDNTQAFFARPVEGVDTFYSPRKFFGLPDGAYLYSNKLVDDLLERDESYPRFEHLLRRIDNGPETAYPIFSENDRSLSDLPLRSMSNLTRRLLCSIDYEEVAHRRSENFALLHECLCSLNRITFRLEDRQVPLTYPFHAGVSSLRRLLVEKRVYTAQYWPNVIAENDVQSVEYDYAANIVHLPIDQRYDSEVMQHLIGLMMSIL